MITANDAPLPSADVAEDDPAAQLLPAAGDAYRVAVAINAVMVRDECEACLASEESVHG